jgi:oligoendopeptidase F
MITNKFVFELEVEGEKKKLTRGELMTYVRHPALEMRAAAYQELYRVYGQEASVLSQIYIHRVRDWANENVKLRNFSSPIAVRNLANDIPDKVVDTLLNVSAEQAPVFHRYFRLKAGWLGMPKLRRYDLYAPLNKESGKKIAYGDAVDMVLDSLNEFSPVVATHARRVFDEGHIDSEVRPGKRGGAFCASILPGVTPWVLANYTEEPREVATLAHELGHAIHALMAADHSVLTFHSALPLAETASVFAEMLLTDRLLAEENDPALRRDILAEAIDDAYATILRQAYFVIFEREAHRMITEGSTNDQLNQLYLSNLTQQFGDSIEINEEFQREWICIPHIYHTPFYCYAYSFGQLLALSLYQRYKEQGEAFKPTLLKILTYGGSASPDHILNEAGVNMADPDFWRGGLKFIEGMVNELEKISVTA